MEQQNTARWGGIFLMLTLFIISGNPAMSFGLPHQPFYVAVAALFFFLMVLQQIEIVTPSLIGIFIFFAFILIYQSYSFSFFPVVTLLGFFVRLFIAYAAVRLIKDFARSYVVIIYWLAILSFIFYIPQQIGNLAGFYFPAIFRPIEPIFGEPQGWRMTLFVHTFIFYQDMVYRNDGIFWEPGALAGYVNLGIILLASIRDQYEKRAYQQRLAMLVACLLSTLSTTGYIVLPLALLLHLNLEGKIGISKAIHFFFFTLVTIAIFVGFFAVAWEQPFMKEKIMRSIFVAQYKPDNWEADRIGTILFDLDYIEERPLTGWGLHEDTRNLLHPFLTGLAETGRGNGMSDFAAKIGLPALFLWMYCVFKYFFIMSEHNTIKSCIGFLCVVIILNGECYLNYPLFLCFFFLSDAIQFEQKIPALISEMHKKNSFPVRLSSQY